MESDDLFGKVEADVEIKASAESFHKLFKHRPHHIANVSSEIVHGCELLEGEWGTEGSILFWTYFHDGEKRVAKEVIEAIDDENNSITLNVIEGDIMEHFSSFRCTLKVSPKADGEGSKVHWILEYKKRHTEIIDPHSLLQLAAELSQELDNHLIQA